MPETILRLGPKNAGERVSADEFALAEFVAPYRYERVEYHRIGVNEYVIVDRFKREALVLSWREDDYEERVLPETGTYTSPLLPGLEIPLAEAFA